MRTVKLPDRKEAAEMKYSELRQLYEIVCDWGFDTMSVLDEKESIDNDIIEERAVIDSYMKNMSSYYRSQRKTKISL